MLTPSFIYRYCKQSGKLGDTMGGTMGVGNRKREAEFVMVEMDRDWINPPQVGGFENSKGNGSKDVRRKT